MLKLETMISDPQFRGRLKPSRTQLSLQKGDFECQIREKEILLPIVLEHPGLHSFKVVIQCETPESGPICRTDMVSVNVGPGKADPKLTKVAFMDFSKGKLKGMLIDVTLRNEKGQLLGPGFSRDFKAMIGRKEVEIQVEDQLDGTYRIKLLPSVKTKARVSRARIQVVIMFRGTPIWKRAIYKRRRRNRAQKGAV